LPISRDLMSSISQNSIHYLGSPDHVLRYIATNLSGSAYVIGDVDHHYLIIEVAGSWNICTYGGAFSVLYANHR
jgi:hypothetical protein